jgi:hypothetical protein
MIQSTERQTLSAKHLRTPVGIRDDDTGLGYAPDATVIAPPLDARSAITTVLYLVKQHIFPGNNGCGSESKIASYLSEGSTTLTSTKGGSDTPSDCTQISEQTTVTKLKNCRLSDELTLNGSLTVTFAGSACTPTAIHIVFENITFSDEGADVSLTIGYLDLFISEINYYNADDHITHCRLALDGDACATVGGCGHQIKFSNFTTIMNTMDDINFSYQYAGSLTVPCLDGSITLTTLVPVKISAHEVYPTAGKVQLSGSNDLLISYQSNSRFTIHGPAYKDCTPFEMPCL